MKTSIILKLSLLALVPLTSQARVKCDAAATSCYFTKMPIYNQNDSTIGKDLLPNGASKSMLCGPTAGSMALQGVVSEVQDPKTGVLPTSWTQKTFLTPVEGKSLQERQNHQIRVMASLMGSSPTTGTSSSTLVRGIYGRRTDFKTAAGASTANPSSFPNENYINYVKNEKTATVINYGHYTRSSTSSLGKTYYSYKRNGGHYVTVNGYSGSKLLIYDPWYAAKVERQVSLLQGGCAGNVCQNLPALSQRSVLFTSGSSYKIIDYHTRLGAD